MEPFLPILLSLLLYCSPAAAYTPTITTTFAQIQPTQLTALRSMNFPFSIDPCSDSATVVCDRATPFRRLLSLNLSNCPDYLSLSSTSLHSLSTLTALELIHCPINSRINTDPLKSILENLKNLTYLTISGSNLTGKLPEKWDLNLTHIDLSNNRLEDKIPNSMKDLKCLKFLSLESNSLSGEIPDFICELGELEYLNLMNNKFSNKNCSRHGSDWSSTNTVRVMAIVLSSWIVVILFVMLVANCCPV